MTEPEKMPTFADLEHDVRNLAAAMQSAVDVIRSDNRLSSESKDMIAILDRQLDLLVKRTAKFCNQTVPCDTQLDRTASSVPPHDEDLSQLRKFDVMIVDDTRLVTYTLKKLLETLGQHVRTASSGASAMDAILEKLPDLVFSDIGMAGMDGYELARQIRSVPRGGDVYLVALTGHSSIETKRDAIAAGFDECHEKPMASATLLKILQHLDDVAEDVAFGYSGLNSIENNGSDRSEQEMAEDKPIELVDLRSLEGLPNS